MNILRAVEEEEDGEYKDEEETEGREEERYTGTEGGEDEEEEGLDENFFNFLLVKLLSFHSASSRAVR